ncbi:hypothetical protein ABZ682_38805 [Streptomyces griseoviridis]|uniref:hypothetical protein n=1 Tax=Streptomyces griseoviridis TaxID=45398 RepID=UPI00340635D7
MRFVVGRGDVRVLERGAEGVRVGEGVVVRQLAPSAEPVVEPFQPGATSQELVERCRTGRSSQLAAESVGTAW